MPEHEVSIIEVIDFGDPHSTLEAYCQCGWMGVAQGMNREGTQASIDQAIQQHQEENA